MTCPQCSEVQYIVCSNRDCVCWKRIPEGKLPQRDVGHDALACPYCGFTEHIDYWEEREVQQLCEALGVKTLAAAYDKMMENAK